MPKVCISNRKNGLKANKVNKLMFAHKNIKIIRSDPNFNVLDYVFERDNESGDCNHSKNVIEDGLITLE